MLYLAQHRLTSPVRNSFPVNETLFVLWLGLTMNCGTAINAITMIVITISSRNSQRRNVKYESTPEPNLPNKGK